MAMTKRKLAPIAELNAVEEPVVDESHVKPANRIVAYLELIGFIGVLVAIDYLFQPMDGFENVNPNPYWIPVILLSVQYGVFEGLTAAVAASLASLLSGVDPGFFQLLMDQGPGAAFDRASGSSFETFTNEDYLIAWEYASQPILWIVSALFVGLLRERLRQRNQELEIDLGQTAQRERVLTDAYNALLETKEQLEVRVAGQLRTVFTLYQAAKAIEKLGPGEVLIGIADLVRAVMQPTKFSLYLLNGSMLEAVTNDGWEDEDTYARVFDSNTAIFREVVGRQRFLSAVNSEDERLLEGQGILAGPLTSVESGEVVGMLKIEKMGFLELHVSSLENFRILSDWVGTAFSNARRFRKAQGNMFLNEDSQLFTDAVYRANTKFMKLLGEKFGLGISAIQVKAAGLDVVRPEQKAAFVAVLKNVVESHMPEFVQVYEHRQSGRDFALMIPGAHPETAGPRLAERIQLALQKAIDDSVVEGVTVKAPAKAIPAPDVTANEDVAVESRAS